MRFALFLLLFSSSAFAGRGNDGPSGAPLPPAPPVSRVVVESVSACGFFCPEGDYRGIRVLIDGTVVSFQGKRNVVETVKPVAKLAAGPLANLKKQVSSLEIVELVDESEGQPECMDAPGTTYFAYQAGVKSRIAARFGCHNHVMKNGMGRNLEALLDAFASLGE